MTPLWRIYCWALLGTWVVADLLFVLALCAAARHSKVPSPTVKV